MNPWDITPQAEGSFARRLLTSPFFTGVLVPAVILGAGILYHFAQVRSHQAEQKVLRDELQTLQHEKEQIEEKLRELRMKSAKDAP